MEEILSRLGGHREASRRKKIEAILNAGKKIFFEKGFMNATMREIARESQLSTGTIYFYFKGKDEIYGMIVEEAFNIMLNFIGEEIKTVEDPLEKLSAITRAYIRFYTDNPEYFDILGYNDFGFRRVGLPDKVLERLDNLSIDAFKVLNSIMVTAIEKGLISDKRESWDLTFAFWASISGIIFIHKRGYLDRFNIDIENIVEIELDILLRGVSPE